MSSNASNSKHGARSKTEAGILAQAMDCALAPSDGWQRLKIALLTTVVVALMANIYAWTNPLFSHDSTMIYQCDWGWQISIGRPLQQFYVMLRGAIVAPLLIGIIGTIYLCVANCLVVSLLDIKSRLFVVASCAILSCNATLTLVIATFIDWYDIMMLSNLLACISVWLCKRYRLGFLAGAVVLGVGLSLYQGYLQVAIVLLIALCIKKVVESSLKDAVAFVGKSLMVIIGGAVLYYVITIAAQSVLDTPATNSYNSVASAFNFRDSSLAAILGRTWLGPFRYFSSPETYGGSVAGICNVIIAVIALVALVATVVKRKLSAGAIVLLIVGLALLPIGTDFMRIAAPSASHALVFYDRYEWYPFAMMLIAMALGAEKSTASSTAGANDNSIWLRRAACVVGCLTCLVVGLNVIYANQVYLKKGLEYQATELAVNRMIVAMEDMDGYVVGETPVLFVGDLGSNPVLNPGRTGFPPFEGQELIKDDGTYGDYGFGLGATLAVRSNIQMTDWMEYVMGYPVNMVDESVLGGDAGALSAVTESPVYPTKGSIFWAGDVLVVHLS